MHSESRRLKLLSLLPVLFIPFGLVPLMLVNPPRVYSNVALYFLLTMIFSVAIPLAAAVLAAHAYLRHALPGVLALGCGMIFLGAGSFASAMARMSIRPSPSITWSPSSTSPCCRPQPVLPPAPPWP
ncbi:MAG: hypothetical protein HQK81_06885 [Desulfovibrionaceae bacterium]|nr:hypothetical protein [Desulfovibrionaceae bacterium]MBF0513775.1 hypothetical protein [Desulfovibrionaceae bacterium]